jgi:hypothetical protein
MIMHAIKKETEQIIYPLWLVHIIKASLEGTEVISIDKFLNTNEKTTTSKTNEEILNEFEKIVELDKKN